MSKNMSQGDPLVTIRCTVYNHEPYLRQCLDGFVMQKTTFPFEAIVHDDASTDGSAAIICEYAEKYPDIIKPIYETENQYSKGTLDRIIINATHPNSKYIATCEGDDYWTDPNKLQLQVDFLESHPDFFFICHAFEFYFEDTKEFKSHPFVEGLPMNVFEGRKYCTPSLDNYWKGPWFTRTLTIVRRREVFVERVKLDRDPIVYDYIWCYYLMKAGKCALFEDVMGVYRKHSGGVFSGKNMLKWKEDELANYCCLYDLEKDGRVLPRIDGICVDLFFLNFKERGFKEAILVIMKYIRKMPIKHSLLCVGRIISLSISSVARKIQKMCNGIIRKAY